ncbi:hypothetical protein X750_28525 [Mesorhizobium sp. LNJC394B00]|nr:hypothetical protein X750_28525 [Mesorhizobium sp. LNJC394B00]
MLLQAFYSIRSERLLMERLEYDLLFRWFVGIGVDDAAHHAAAPRRPRREASDPRGDMVRKKDRKRLTSPIPIREAC